MRYTAIILILAACGILTLCATLFDRSTLGVVCIALGIVGIFGTLPVLFGVITRRRVEQQTPATGDDDEQVEVVDFESKHE